MTVTVHRFEDLDVLNYSLPMPLCLNCPTSRFTLNVVFSHPTSSHQSVVSQWNNNNPCWWYVMQFVWLRSMRYRFLSIWQRTVTVFVTVFSKFCNWKLFPKFTALRIPCRIYSSLSACFLFINQVTHVFFDNFFFFLLCWRIQNPPLYSQFIGFAPL